MALLSSDGSKKGGYTIVLTTDKTLASDYNGSIFLGFGATFPKILPMPLYNYLFLSPLPHDEGVMKYGHCGSRKIEAALLYDGFTEKDVVVAHPEKLNKVVGSQTKVVGITTHDPLGLGPASTTFSEFINEEPYSSYYFKDLIRDRSIRDNDVKVIVGGPGTWQLEDEDILKKYRIDSIVLGEGEKVAPELFRRAINDEKIPSIVEGEVVPKEEIPIIKKPTINGLVEISRGCGRGCNFCNPTLLNLRHRSVDEIVEEVKINNKAGAKQALLHAEDVLRYGSKRLIPEPEKLMHLLQKIKKITSMIGFSHSSLASAACQPELIEDITELLNIGSNEYPFTSLQVGIETGSVRLVKKQLRGKVKPFDVEDWPSVVMQAIAIFNENSWIPCATLIMGLPSENQDDIMRTIELLDDIERHDVFVVPLMFVPLGVQKKERFFTKEDMTPEHWQLLAKCIRMDFDISDDMILGLAEMDDIHFLKKYSFMMMKKYMQKRLEPYVKKMERGVDPVS
ncbi:MAG: B12-binding domain-containing radical SAM protein [Thermoplasmatota archaeon]